MYVWGCTYTHTRVYSHTYTHTHTHTKCTQAGTKVSVCHHHRHGCLTGFNERTSCLCSTGNSFQTWECLKIITLGIEWNRLLNLTPRESNLVSLVCLRNLFLTSTKIHSDTVTPGNMLWKHKCWPNPDTPWDISGPLVLLTRVALPPSIPLPMCTLLLSLTFLLHSCSRVSIFISLFQHLA
jgi:hypothetical protein